MLADAIGFQDRSCVELLRAGAPIIGELPRFNGGGERLLVKEEVDLNSFAGRAAEINEKVLTRLREDPHAEALHSACEEDASKGRMSKPRVATPADCLSGILAPRFGIEQGVKEDGSLKIRPIDDFTACEVNRHTHAVEKATNDSLDKLLEAVRQIHGNIGNLAVSFCMLGRALQHFSLLHRQQNLDCSRQT